GARVPERAETRDTQEEHAGRRVDVGGRGGRAALPLLRRHVGGRATGMSTVPVSCAAASPSSEPFRMASADSGVRAPYWSRIALSDTPGTASITIAAP